MKFKDIILQIVILFFIFPRDLVAESGKYISVMMDGQIKPPCVAITVNGKPAKFIIDITANASFISRKYFDINFNNLYLHIINNADEEIALLPDTNFNLMVGNFPVGQVSLLVRNSKYLDDLGVDGVLGFHTLKNFNFSIQFKQHKFLIGEINFPEKLTAIEFIGSLNIALISVMIEENKYWMVVGTSYYVTQLNVNDYIELTESKGRKEQKDYLKEKNILQDDKIQQSKYVIADIYIPNKNLPNIEIKETTGLSILGMDALEQLDIYYNKNSNRMFLK